ncbi:UPF0175 family protein [Candidatus Poribacteria bacterium]
MSRTVTIEVPDQLLELLGSEDEIGKEAKRSLVLSLVGRGKISRGKAAELLGMSLWDLPNFLSEYRIPWFDYTKKQLEEDIAALRNLDEKAGV